MDAQHLTRCLAQLSEGLDEIQVAIADETKQLLIEYLALLIKWNSAYNLTGIRDPQAMIPQLLLDALVALPLLKQGPILDVGSGAGLPGLPLAIAQPHLRFVLLDSNGKKIRFIKQVVTMLQLPNVDVVQSRLEAYVPVERFAWIVSRAFSELPGFVSQTKHLLADSGQWLAWKGSEPDLEITQAQRWATLQQRIPVALPGVTQVRCLLILAPAHEITH